MHTCRRLSLARVEARVMPRVALCRYRIVPQGSFSRFTKVGDERRTHELFNDGRYFSISRLNQGLKCLVQCVKVRVTRAAAGGCVGGFSLVRHSLHSSARVAAVALF